MSPGRVKRQRIEVNSQVWAAPTGKLIPAPWGGNLPWTRHWEKPPRERAAIVLSQEVCSCLLPSGGEGDRSSSVLGTPLHPNAAPALPACPRGVGGVRGGRAKEHHGCSTPFGLILVHFSGPHLTQACTNKLRWVKKSLT